MNQYMINIKLPPVFTNEFLSLIPKQKNYVDELMDSGTVLSYMLALDRSHLWIIMMARTERQVIGILSGFPLISFMKPEISELAFYEATPVGMPKLILN